MSVAILKSAARRMLGLGIWLSCAVQIGAQENPRFLEPWGAVFAEEQAVFHVQSDETPAGWSLALSGAVVARGETATIEHPFPPLRDGLAVEGVLTAETSRGRTNKALWLFSRKPDFPSIENLMVFDPIGATADLLESNGIPFQILNTVDELAKVAGGVLIVGEGILLNEYKGLADSLYGAASRGARILWLAPAEGRMALPGGRPALDFRDATVVAMTDKRLKPEDWRERNAVASSFQLVGDRRMAEMEWVSTADEGWCWMDARWPNGGRLMICGLSIAGSWEDNPAPRYLLARWLADLEKSE